MMFGRTPGTAEVKPAQSLHDEQAVARILGVWQEQGGPVWEEALWADLPDDALPSDDRRLAVRRFTRSVDTSWRRTSYSALSAAAAEPDATRAAVASEPEVRPKDDEPEVVVEPEAATPSPGAVVSPMADLPVGATFGSLVHAVLEHADPQAADLRAELRAQVREQLVRWPVPVDVDVLADALVAVCETPLGPLAEGVTLRDVGARDRLCEMDFELPLAGGDVRGQPAAAVTLGDVAPLLRAHLRRRRPAAALRRDARVAGARGTAAARLPHRLGRRGAAAAGRPLDGLRRARHQPLPRRRLQDQLAGRPAGHRGAAAHLRRLPPRRAAGRDDALRLPPPGAAVRRRAAPVPALAAARLRPRSSTSAACSTSTSAACAGPDTPLVDGQPCGVFAWRPPAALVEAVSDLLDGSTVEVGHEHPTEPLAALASLTPLTLRRGPRMTELVEFTDAADARVALGATGLLHDFNVAGVLTAADVHVASRTGRLAGERDERVLLAVALATRAVRNGSVGVDLATVADVAPDLGWPDPDGWAELVAASPVAAAGVVRLDQGLLYLDRYWRQEGELCTDLQARLARPAPVVDAAALEAGLLRVFAGDTYDEQRAASRRAAGQWTTVLTGGPGTGKTTTVAGLLALLAEQRQLAGLPPLRIALSAPTGKASARLQQAVATATQDLEQVDRDRLGHLSAVTLHRLLGTRRDNGTRFRHHRGNRLPHDVVVVDESSMVSLTMMTRLLEAVRPDARLLLVGDPDQLASVEAGAVLGDLVAGLSDREPSPVASLRTTHRFGEQIGELAAALRGGSPDDVLDVLRSGAAAVELVETEDPSVVLRTGLVQAAVELHRCAVDGPRRGRRGRAGPAPAALRAPRRAVRRAALEPPGAALAVGGRRRPALRADVRRSPAAGHRQRLRPRRPQRRRGRRGADAPTGAGRSSPGRRGWWTSRSAG